MEGFLHHAAPTLALIGLALLVLPHCSPNNPWPRAIGAALTAFLMLRYLWWRATETLPGPEQQLEFLLGHAFFAVEIVSCVAGLLLLHVLSRTKDRSAEADAHPVEQHAGGPPSIAVLIPTYNEGREILLRTITGAISQDYPAFRVHVLDDGRREWLRELALSLGAEYRTRADNAHGKAGNMNAALHDILGGMDAPDAIAVLDADFVAGPKFLRRAAALLHDPQVACVQTPQLFFNPDPIQLNLGGRNTLADEQRFFFDVIMASKDAHGTAFSCGTSALIRSSALRQIGLFPTESVTEDLLLSIKFASIGHRTVYLNETLTSGLAPEGLHEYLTQRGRWCLGTMQIVRTAWGPLSHGANVPLMTRLHTLDTVLFWTVGSLMRLLCLLVPILYWWTGVAVMQTDLAGMVSHLGPYWVAAVVYLGWVSRGTNLPILAEAMSLLVTREALRASVVGLFGSKNQKFKVTAKGASRDAVLVQWSVAIPLIVLALLTAGGIAVGLWRGAQAGTPPDVETMNVFWSVFNIITLIVAVLVCVEQPRFRREERFAADEQALLRQDARDIDVRLVDISLTGCSVDMAGEMPPRGAVLALRIQDVGLIDARVAWHSPGRLHLDFVPSQRNTMLLIQKLFSGRYVRPIREANPAQVARLLFRRAFG